MLDRDIVLQSRTSSQKFPDKARHQLFLEPEGLDTYEVYVNGMSTSMPVDVQEAMLASIEGLENAEMIRPGYAIEYDAIDPRELDHSLQVQVDTRFVPGWADQWHFRIRGSRLSGDHSWDQCCQERRWPRSGCRLPGLKDIPVF